MSKCNQCGQCCLNVLLIDKDNYEVKEFIAARGGSIVKHNDDAGLIAYTLPARCQQLRGDAPGEYYCVLGNVKPQRCKDFPEIIDLLLPGCGYADISPETAREQEELNSQRNAQEQHNEELRDTL